MKEMCVCNFPGCCQTVSNVAAHSTQPGVQVTPQGVGAHCSLLLVLILGVGFPVPHTWLLAPPPLWAVCLHPHPFF